MKHTRRFVTLIIVLAMVMMMAVSASADEERIITLTNAAIGKEYNAYKILDATYSGNAVSYTTKTPANFKGDGSVWVVSDVADANGNYNVTLAANKTAADISTWVNANIAKFTAIAPTTGITDGKASSDTITWTNLDYGYYYVTSGLGTVVTIDNVKPSATVVDKNVTNPSDLNKVSDSATAQINDVVKFTVTFTATNYITDNTTTNGVVSATTAQVASYTVKDTADGFDFLVDATHPVTVQVGNRTASTVAAPTITQQTDSASGTMEFVIDWDNANGDTIYNYSENVTITYYGTVNAYADDGAAANSVVVSNSTGSDTLEAKTTTTNTYNLTINKTDGTNPLVGAKFELYRGDANTALSLIDITAANATNKEYRIAEAGEANAVTTIDMSAVSTAIIYGLDGADTYNIKEIEAPAGYNKLDSLQAQDMNNTNATANVVNKAGSLLPSTGGMGTTIFYILGGLLAVGALVVLVTNKRMRGTN